MVAAVPGHESYLSPGDLADNQRIARQAKRGLDGYLFGGVEKFIQPGAADDADAGQAGRPGA